MLIIRTETQHPKLVVLSFQACTRIYVDDRMQCPSIFRISMFTSAVKITGSQCQICSTRNISNGLDSVRRIPSTGSYYITSTTTPYILKTGRNTAFSLIVRCPRHYYSVLTVMTGKCIIRHYPSGCDSLVA